MPQNISDLFPELLAKCFIHTRDLYIGTAKPYTWLRIMQVCRYWHDIALAYPTLWSYINLTKIPPSIGESLLRQSGAAPLTIKLTRPLYVYPVQDLLDDENRVDSVLSQVHRVQDLCLQLPHAVIDKLIKRSFDSLRAPLLRSLSITRVSIDSEDGPLPFSLELPTPTLTFLDLCDFSYHHISPLFQLNLRHLDINPPMYPSLDVLLGHLQCMPRLEFLALWRLDPEPHDDGETKLRLDQLKSLSLGGGVGIVELMTRLAAPPSRMSISVSFEASSAAAEREKILTIFDTASILSRCGKKSTEPFNESQTICSVYIDLSSTYRYETWGWTSVLPPVVDPHFWLQGPSLDEREKEYDESFVYRLDFTVEDDEDDPEGLPTLYHNLNFSYIQTLAFNLTIRGWINHRNVIKAILDALNSTVETLIAVQWNLLPLAAFLTTGDCMNTAALSADDESPLMDLPPIPFPHLRTLTVDFMYPVQGESITPNLKLPMTKALKYRANHGFGIEYLYLGDQKHVPREGRDDLEQAVGFVTSQGSKDSS